MTARKRNTCSRLRHRLSLQQENRTSDGAGGYVRSWETVADLWAEILPATGGNSQRSFGKEALFADQLQSEVTHRIVLRYRGDVTSGMRLQYESRAFNVLSVVNSNEDSETLELLVREGAAA